MQLAFMYVWIKSIVSFNDGFVLIYLLLNITQSLSLKVFLRLFFFSSISKFLECTPVLNLIFHKIIGLG